MRKRVLIGVIVGVVIILLLGGIIFSYFMFFKDERKIKGFTYEIPNFNRNEMCTDTDEFNQEICVIAIDSVIYYGTGETNDVVRFNVTKGFSESRLFTKSLCENPENNCDILQYVVTSFSNGPTKPSFTWYYSNTEYITIKQWGENVKSYNSKVIEHFFEKYPPIPI